MTTTQIRLQAVPGTTPSIHDLCWDDDFSSTVLSKTFAQMVVRAEGVIKSYHGDLFHDAEWLRRNVSGTKQFYWSARECGTYIGLAPTWLEEHISEEGKTYEVIIGQTGNGHWVVCFGEIEAVR